MTNEEASEKDTDQDQPPPIFQLKMADAGLTEMTEQNSNVIEAPAVVPEENQGLTDALKPLLKIWTTAEHPPTQMIRMHRRT